MSSEKWQPAGNEREMMPENRGMADMEGVISLSSAWKAGAADQNDKRESEE
ncbi:hypothetical protein [Porcincola intestinalis]|uniref:hypothetical protein n=1 Tax=Porcincola intestinalis TaxID=2606632 RepID=UPI0012B1E574|nr:hypothetical protein [Porcincola intestinalis]MDY4205408.1 hypothetical protein [Porcincola intestinalis]MDY5580322.1 hypothetical protein [Porcincola intestinalis]